MESAIERIDCIVNQIKPPQCGAVLVSIVDFGAVSHSTACQTKAIQTAIDYVCTQGGGRVIVPDGSFLTGALHLKSGVELHLSQHATLLFTTQTTQQHYPLVYCHWEASPCYNYSPLIYAKDAQNIAVTGKGILDAQSSYDNWWGWHHQVEDAWSKDGTDLQSPARMALRRMNEDGTPIEQRRFGDGHFLRPNFIQTIDCENVLIADITLLHSPMWQLNPVRCKNVIIRGVTLSAKGPNSDGCDPESCNGVLIENCRFDTGDDCISLKSGRDRDGRNAPPCENVVIRNNIFLNGHGGIALGSEMSGGIRGVYAQHNRFESPDLTYVLRFKTNAKRGGYIEDVWLYDTVATAVSGAAVHATMMYEDGPYGDYLPRFENIQIERLQANGGEYGIFLEAFDTVPIRGLVLRDITLENVENPLRAMNWLNPVLERVTINQIAYPCPTQAHLTEAPYAGKPVSANAYYLGAQENTLQFFWHLIDGTLLGEGLKIMLPVDSANKQFYVTVKAPDGAQCSSRAYCILSHQHIHDSDCLIAANLLSPDAKIDTTHPITRIELARLLAPLYNMQPCQFTDITPTHPDYAAVSAVVHNGILSLHEGAFRPNDTITRQELATVAMQCCGVSYRNASSTMPRCTDVKEVSIAYGTNVARSLYFGFLQCDNNNLFYPTRAATWQETIQTIARVIQFAAL